MPRMRVLPPALRRGAAAVAAVVCAACSLAPQPNAAPRSEASVGGAPPAELAQRIDALIGAARCRDDGDCRSIAIGARACGGPEAFRAWSVLDTDAAALERAVEAHREQRQRQIDKGGVMSTCAMLLDPGSRCIGATAAMPGQCRLRPPSMFQPASPPVER